jgi:CRISPR-associated protein Cmr5
MQTRDQKYAADVYKRVSEVKKEGKAFYEGYGAMSHQLPILIHTAGLAQALAFVESRKEPQQRLLADLAETVGKKGTLLERAREAKLSEYMYLTQQVLAALLWYKRFAQSVLGIETSDTNTLSETNMEGKK